MIDRDSLMAELDAARLLEAHGDQIAATVYEYGQRATVATLRALATIIEDSEFAFTAETFH